MFFSSIQNKYFQMNQIFVLFSSWFSKKEHNMLELTLKNKCMIFIKRKIYVSLIYILYYYVYLH